MYNNEFRSMKRAHSPDSSFENSNNSFRGHQQPFRGPPGGHHNHHHNNHNNQYQNQNNQFNKRHRGDIIYNQPQTLEEEIAKLGIPGTHNAEIGKLAKKIEHELTIRSGDEEKIKNITSQISKCIASFPTRIATYSTLVGLISIKHYEVSRQIINCLHASYPVYLEAQKWQEALTIIRFLSSLVNCKVISPDSLIAQFQLLLEVTQEENVPQVRADYFVYTVMSSLPYVAHELASQTEPNNFEELLTNIETYLSKRSHDHLKATRVWSSNDLTVQMDYLDSLWVQLKNFRANNWIEMYLHKPYNDKDYKDIMAASLIPQNSPPIQIPSHLDGYIYPSPRIVLRIFEDDITEMSKSIPSSDKIERFCIENQIRNLIDEIPIDARSCARNLSHLYKHEHLPIRHLIIETVLGELFALPKTRQQEFYYQTILYELSKVFCTTYNPSGQSKNPEEMKSTYEFILNQAIKVLFENLETFNVTCYTRFVEWLSFHLNNTDFVFPWVTWTEATKDKTSTKALFVQEVLTRCINFSFHKKISTIVSVSLPDLMPPEVVSQYKPVFSDNPRAEELAATIKKLITERADGPTICQTLNIVIDGVQPPEGFVLQEEKLSDKLLKIDIFTAVIISIASKSLTHVSSAIGKYRNVFKALVREEGGQVQLLQTVHSCLENHTQLQVILIDKLLKAELVDAKEVCNWLFSDSMKPHYLRSYPWEILKNTTIRSLQVLRKFKNEADDLEKETARLELEKEAKSAAASEPTVEEESAVKIKQEKGDDETSEQQQEETDKGEEVADAAAKDTTNTDATSNEEDVEMRNEQAKSKLQIKIAEADKNFHDLLVKIFTMFAELINNHIIQSETNGVDYRDSWYRWITGRMQQIYYNHYDTIQSRDDILKIILDYLNYK